MVFQVLLGTILPLLLHNAHGQKLFLSEDTVYPSDDRAWGYQDNVRYSPPQQVPEWPQIKLNLGQVTGVTLNRNENPVIFHRGPNTWNSRSFNSQNQYLDQSGKPIGVNTILELDKRSGKIVKSWGKDIFYMPHGITIDDEGNVWTTDVALHQVMKFSPNSTEPSLVLGEKFVPGNDSAHFCKPTSVAVSTKGDIFVADGYCNSRVMRFDKNGNFMSSFGSRVTDDHRQVSGYFYIPHSLALHEELDLICVADRENDRIQCFQAGLRNNKMVGTPKFEISGPEIGPVYAVAFGGDLLFAVTGPNIYGSTPVIGLTIDIFSGHVLNIWGPEEGFRIPHALDSTADGEMLYVTDIDPMSPKIWKFRKKMLGNSELLSELDYPRALP